MAIEMHSAHKRPLVGQSCSAFAIRLSAAFVFWCFLEVTYPQDI
jgi:hypothetical protein